VGPVAKPTAGHLFDEIQRTFLEQHRYGTATTESYIALATELSGDTTVRPFLDN
jgi:hypothetical protein